MTERLSPPFAGESVPILITGIAFDGSEADDISKLWSGALSAEPAQAARREAAGSPWDTIVRAAADARLNAAEIPLFFKASGELPASVCQRVACWVRAETEVDSLSQAVMSLNADNPAALVASFDGDCQATVALVIELEREGGHQRAYACIASLSAALQPAVPDGVPSQLMVHGHEQCGISPLTLGLTLCHDTGETLSELRQLVGGWRKELASAHPLGGLVAVGHVRRNHSGRLSLLYSMAIAALSLSQRVIPPLADKSAILAQADGLTCYADDSARPWFHPILQGEESLRCASIKMPGAYAVLTEGQQLVHVQRRGNLLRRDCELFLLSASSAPHLLDKIIRLKAVLVGNATLLPEDVAFSLSFAFKHEHAVRAAFVASSIEEAIARLEMLSQHLTLAPGEAIDRETQERASLFYNGGAVPAGGKVAFVLPGLGAAYPHMLSELCLHFDEVRAVFDFVDGLAIRAGERMRPSWTIFPSRAEAQFTASWLATSDEAVITVLMAEWALFTLLTNFGLKSDALVGCSTGEFAALTMCGSFDVVEAADLFYRLSTQVARAVPPAELASLRSIRCATAYDALSPVLDLHPEVFLAADLAPGHIFVSGRERDMASFCQTLAKRGIEYFDLPIAIPYHTSLVSGHINADGKEIVNLKVEPPDTEAWSCSRVDRYPSDTKAIRRIATALFEEPIRLRPTIEKLYDEGFRTFIEIGPKGSLCRMVEATLKGRAHLVLPANVPGRSSLRQLNHVLASLCTAGFDLCLDYLWQRRKPQRVDEIACAFSSLADPVQGGGARVGEISYLSDGADAQVITSYFETLRLFHRKLISNQESVMLQYLSAKGCSGAGQVGLPPMLRGARLRADGSTLVVTMTVTLDQHLYLLDHAIGGDVQVEPRQRVYLMPLMVAIEIMVEAASLKAPQLMPTAVKEVKAFRRMRIESQGTEMEIHVRANSGNSSAITTEIWSDPHGTGSRELLMSCQVDFGASFHRTAPPMPAKVKAQASRFSHLTLYGPEGMFHGPSMQSIVHIDGTSERAISGRASIRAAVNWLRDFPEPPMLVDPLLLDNASQFVLFFLLEKQVEVTALLPFYIEAIEFFGPAPAPGTARVHAHLQALTGRGTEAAITISDSDDVVWAVVRSLNSRRIGLPSKWKRYLSAPSLEHLACPLDLFPEDRHTAFALAVDRDLPAEAATVEWCLDYILSARERKLFASLKANEARKREWLLGRLAAKDAVRSLLLREWGLRLCPADVSVLSLESGQPYVELAVEQSPPHISIAHSNGSAVAAASLHTMVGIDIELVEQREQSFKEMAFTERERCWLSEQSDANLAATKLWSAKEAVCKARRLNLSQYLHQIELARDFSSVFEFAVKNDDRQHQVEVAVSTLDDFVVTCAVCEEKARIF